MNATDTLEREADRILAAANDNKLKPRRVRFRGGRPAWNWLRKKDERGAAALWLIVRRMRLAPANDNHADAAGLTLERRKDGRPRGRRYLRPSIEEYLDLPGVKPRLGDPETVARYPTGLVPRSSLEELAKYPFHPDCRFSFHPPAVARGAIFLGAMSGLGREKPGKSRGDVRRVEEPDLPDIPERIACIIELMLEGKDLASVGRGLGYRGGYADRAGGKAMLEAGRWAKSVIAA